jgi:hypothetical protein
MRLFKRRKKLSDTERLEMALRDKQELRQRLARRLNTAEMFVTDRREAGERLALDGASDESLGRAEESTRAAEDRAKTLRAALAQLEAQITEIERELGASVERRYRDTVADTLETLVAGIIQTAPAYDGAATALLTAVAKTVAALPEATALATDLEDMRREVVSLTTLLCAELRGIAARTRSGEAKIIFRAPSDPAEPYLWQVERETTKALQFARPRPAASPDDADDEAVPTAAAIADPTAEYEPFENEPFPLAEPPQPSNEDFATVEVVEGARAA